MFFTVLDDDEEEKVSKPVKARKLQLTKKSVAPTAAAKVIIQV